jgi:hypothetical protein
MTICEGHHRVWLVHWLVLRVGGLYNSEKVYHSNLGSINICLSNNFEIFILTNKINIILNIQYFPSEEIFIQIFIFF